jgi:large subunit ribosomal protein L18
MARSSRYRVQLRRRREQKTDYQARKAFVVSGRPRLVARSSLKNTIAQIVVAKPYGDIVLASAHSRELIKKYGWKGATGNVPAAYLTGLLCGLKAKKNGVEGAILDLGLVSPIKGCKVFSTLSGVVDAGVEIPHAEDKIVKERTEAEHIVEYAETLGTPEEYAPKFSQSLANKLAPENLGEHFEKVKADIFTAYGVAYTPKPKAEKKPEPKPKAEVKAPPKVVAKAPAPAKVEAPAEAKVEAPKAIKEEVKPKGSAKSEAPAKITEKHEKVEKAKKAEKAEKVEKAAKAEAKPKAKAAGKATKSATKEAKAEESAKAKPAKAAKAKASKSDAKTGGKKE